MNKHSVAILVIGLYMVAFTVQQGASAAELRDWLNGRASGENDPDSAGNIGTRIRDRFRNMMSVNVPLFYDMVKNGSSLGINVLSGLVKVERGEEAERSGLVGRRPLSVRVFGVPVYERGTRIRNPGSGESVPDTTEENEVGESEELPIIT